MGSVRGSSEVQSIQVCDGDIQHGVELLLHMVFPRWFVSTTINTSAFKVSFEVNINIIFANNHVVTENLPLTLFR